MTGATSGAMLRRCLEERLIRCPGLRVALGPHGQDPGRLRRRRGRSAGPPSGSDEVNLLTRFVESGKGLVVTHGAIASRSSPAGTSSRIPGHRTAAEGRAGGLRTSGSSTSGSPVPSIPSSVDSGGVPNRRRDCPRAGAAPRLGDHRHGHLGPGRGGQWQRRARPGGFSAGKGRLSLLRRGMTHPRCTNPHLPACSPGRPNGRPPAR